MDNINVRTKQTKYKLNNNNITYYKLFNIIISFPKTSPQNEALHCPYTKLYYIFNTTILIHKY